MPVPWQLQVGGRGLDVLSVHELLARGSVRPCGRSLGALAVFGVLARGSARPRGRGLGAQVRLLPVPGERGRVLPLWEDQEFGLWIKKSSSVRRIVM